MRYKVEYLSDSEDAKSVCRFRYVYVDTLEEALEKAWEDAGVAERYNGAVGFQIIDLYEERCVSIKRLADHPGRMSG